jgi:hypothetical protein
MEMEVLQMQIYQMVRLGRFFLGRLIQTGIQRLLQCLRTFLAQLYFGNSRVLTPRLQITLAALFFTASISSGCGGSPADDASPQAPISANSKEVNVMPAGFSVVGSHGVVQIDENFFNLVFVAKGTVTPSAGGSFGVISSATVVVNGSTPILCLRSLNGPSLIESVSVSGNTYTYTIRSAGIFTWYLFDKMPASSQSSGLEVRNSSGQVVFNSNYRPMIVQSVGVFPNGAVGANTVTISTVAGTYAVCFNGVGRVETANGVPVGGSQDGTVIFKDGLTVTSTGAVSSRATVAAIPAPYYGTTDGGGNQILLVNVAGL